MYINLSLPNIDGWTEKEQLKQTQKYLFKLVGELQVALNGLYTNDASFSSQKTKNGAENSQSMNIREIRSIVRTIVSDEVAALVKGGRIDSYLPGTLLVATVDKPIRLNDVVTPGRYYSPDAANSQYISDSPYKDGGFGLEVIQIYEGCIRQIQHYNDTTIFRYKDGSEWSDWLRVVVDKE